MSNATKVRRPLPKVGESFLVHVNKPIVVRCTRHNPNGTVGYEFLPDSSNWAQLNEHNLWKSDQSSPTQLSGASGGTSAQHPKQGDSVRVERIYMSSEQQAEEAEFGEVTDNTDEDGLTSGIVLKANSA